MFDDQQFQILCISFQEHLKTKKIIIKESTLEDEFKKFLTLERNAFACECKAFLGNVKKNMKSVKHRTLAAKLKKHERAIQKTLVSLIIKETASGINLSSRQREQLHEFFHKSPTSISVVVKIC